MHRMMHSFFNQTMIKLSLCRSIFILFITVPSVYVIKLTKLKGKECAFSYTSRLNGQQREQSKITGNTYSSMGKDVEICCVKSFNLSSITIDTSMAQKSINCCLVKGTCYYNGMRTCADKICMAKFKKKGDKIIKNEKNVDSEIVKTLCPPKKEPENKKGKILTYKNNNLVAFTDTEKCKDSSKPFHIFFTFADLNSLKVTLDATINWCCTVDVMSNYQIDPRQECCGLSGAGSNNFLPGAMVHVDSPTCCRSSNTRQTCEPYREKVKAGLFNQECSPQAGAWETTTNLNSSFPLSGPMYYAPSDRRSASTEFFVNDVSLEYKSSNESMKNQRYFYLLQNFNDRYVPKMDQDFYGIFCIQIGAFFLEPENIVKDCCIAYVKALGRLNAKPIPANLPKLPCDTKGKGVVKNNQFYYRPCEGFKCVSNSLKRNNKTIGYTSMIKVSFNAYDSRAFFKARYV